MWQAAALQRQRSWEAGKACCRLPHGRAGHLRLQVPARLHLQ